MQAALQTLVRVVSAAMGMAYFVAGLLLVLYASDTLNELLGVPLRIGLGVLLMVYGFYRLIRGAKRTDDRITDERI